MLAKAKEMAHNSMCEKLAVVSVDLLKNQSMTRTMLAQTQQGDDYCIQQAGKVLIILLVIFSVFGS